MRLVVAARWAALLGLALEPLDLVVELAVELGLDDDKVLAMLGMVDFAMDLEMSSSTQRSVRFKELQSITLIRLVLRCTRNWVLCILRTRRMLIRLSWWWT